MPSRSQRVKWVAVIASLLTSQLAQAAPTEAEQRLAQSLFDRGRQLMEAKDYERACPAFAESQRLDPGGGTLLNLALCNERAGKLATAHVQFNEALSIAIRDGRSDRRAIAEERLQAIAPKLSRIAIDVPPGSDLPTLVVTLDGVEVRRFAWGTLTAVDGGTHRIEVTAPGYQAWSGTVDVARERDVQRVRVPPLTKLWVARPRAEPSPPARCPNGTQPTPTGCAPTTSQRSTSPPWLAYGTLGLGGLALGVGATTGVLALQKSSTLDDACDSQNRCPSGLESDVDAYNRLSTASTISFIAAGVLITAGIIQLSLASKSSATALSAKRPVPAAPARR